MAAALPPRLSRVTARRSVRAVALLTVVELVLLALYFTTTPARLTEPRYALYPFVWINVGLWAVLERDLPSAPPRRTLIAGVIALFYFSVLVYLAGLVGFHVPTIDGATGVFVGQGSPGQVGVTLVTEYGYVALIPFRLVGYLALTYLVFATLLDAVGAAVSGAIGLVSCLSCTFPVVASLAAALGGSAALTSTLFELSLDLSTGIFVLAVALLYVRPGLGDG